MQCNFFFDNVPDCENEKTPVCTIKTIGSKDQMYYYEPEQEVINKYCKGENFVNCPRFVNRD